MRLTTFLYIPLLACTALFLRAAATGAVRIGRLSGTGLMILAVVLLFAQKEFPFRRVIREAMLRGGLYSEKRTAQWEKDQRRWKDLMDVAAWARDHTARDALFFHPHYDFRFHAERSIVVGWKDGGLLVHFGAGKIREWLDRKREVKEALDSKDPARVIRTAMKYRCEYVVLRLGEGPPGLDAPAVFENDTYRVWRLDAAPNLTNS